MSIAETAEPIVQTPLPRRMSHPNEAIYEDAPSDSLFEIIDGELVVEKPMGVYQEGVANLLGKALMDCCQAEDLGQVFIEAHIRIPGFNNDRRPDVMFVSYDTSPKERGIPTTNAWSIVPDLAIEVVSPADKLFDVYAKMDEYFQGGVTSVWLVLSHMRIVQCHTELLSNRMFGESDEIIDEPTMPGLRLNVGSIFPKVDTSGGES